jgi:hypothetical protein
MFDIFYSGTKPNLFAHEQQANSIDHARTLTKTRYFWWINYLSDYSAHDFLWEPVPWESNQTHVWPSQHQENGGTYLVPAQHSVEVNRKHHKIPRTKSVPIIGIDHGNGLTCWVDRSSRFISDYLGTLKRVLSTVEDEYVWIVSSVCDYSDFDFTWHPSEWQATMLHVFASNEQKFGDTFYIHVPSFLRETENLALLEWFDTIHFVEDIQVPRRSVPVVQHTHDTHVQAVWEYDFQDPVVEFTVTNYRGAAPAVNLWRESVRDVTPLTPGASRVLVPRDVKNHLKTQLYDYPAINKMHQNVDKDHPLDIVFVSNGEPMAEDNWLHLLYCTRNLPNKTVRIDGVNGRVAAYHAAAKASDTPWFFAVFAKLQVESTFDWYWQPDRLQESKHYIFHAANPVNGLMYGHQAMIAYNKKLVLNNPGAGLDFTLDSPHEVVPILSGTAWSCDNAWICWRTAFREALKLRHSLPNVENAYRLKVWLTPDSGTIANGHWSHKGAQDAVEFYESVNGDFAQIKKSYDWAWLASYAFFKRNLSTDQ